MAHFKVEFNLDEYDASALNIYCEDEGESLNDIVAELLSQYVADMGLPSEREEEEEEEEEEDEE